MASKLKIYDNSFVDSVDERLRVKVTDSALARDLFPDDYHCLGDNENRPIRWMAMETLVQRKFSPASDVVRESALKLLAMQPAGHVRYARCIHLKLYARFFLASVFLVKRHASRVNLCSFKINFVLHLCLLVGVWSAIMGTGHFGATALCRSGPFWDGRLPQGRIQIGATHQLPWWTVSTLLIKNQFYLYIFEQIFSDGLLLVVIARGETDIPAAVALLAGLLHSPRQIRLKILHSTVLPRHSKSSNVILNVKKWERL